MPSVVREDEVNNDQGDLFGSGAERAKREGMDRVDAHADKDWQLSMFIYGKLVAERQEFFTSDDVFFLARDSGMQNWTHDQRAFGPVMLRLAKAGICKKAKCAPINSRRTSLHASPRQVWQSLIYDAPF